MPNDMAVSQFTEPRRRTNPEVSLDAREVLVVRVKRNQALHLRRQSDVRARLIPLEPVMKPLAVSRHQPHRGRGEMDRQQQRVGIRDRR
jgi:hypothetical protein